MVVCLFVIVQINAIYSLKIYDYNAREFLQLQVVIYTINFFKT